MPMRRGDRDAWAAALSSQAVWDRWSGKVMRVPGSECLWWVGAISGRGHGRFWLGRGRVVIAHRFAFALVAGLDALAASPLLGHRCDNPLCQRVGAGHVVVSSAGENRREWVRRRDRVDSPLADPRGSRPRAEVLRALARVDPAGVRAEIGRVRAALPEQLALW
jgi:hypothetical protein